MGQGGFYVHLADAIAINKVRREIYSARSGGRTRSLSFWLIAFERSTLPLAWWLDRRARPFNERGIPIVAADFVDMVHIRPPETPPRLTGVAPESAFTALGAALDRLRARVKPAVKRNEFLACADAAMDLIHEIDALSEAHRAHFCMARHFVESLGIACIHAEDYGRRSQRETDALARSFISSQVLGLRFVRWFDRRTQPFLAEGIGIVWNDIPEIPFEKEYAESRRAPQREVAAPAAP